MVISRYKWKDRGAESPSLTLLPFAAEFTGPPQKPPRLGAQVCVDSARAGNEFESGLLRLKAMD